MNIWQKFRKSFYTKSISLNCPDILYMTLKADSIMAIVAQVSIVDHGPNYLSFKGELALYLNKLESPFPNIALCQV